VIERRIAHIDGLDPTLRRYLERSAEEWRDRAACCGLTPHEPINSAHVIGTTRKMILSLFGLPTTLRPCVDSDSSRL
jgi:hypothetical protein